MENCKHGCAEQGKPVKPIKKSNFLVKFRTQRPIFCPEKIFNYPD
jgi:hypothetical protein